MVYNVNAARALRNEATGATWQIQVDGALFELPREIPMELAEKLEEFKGMPGTAGIRGMLGVLLGDQEGFPFGKLSGQDLGALFDAYMDEVNVSLGESKGSSTSSTSTPAPSKPTSKPRTASASRKSTKARSASAGSKF